MPPTCDSIPSIVANLEYCDVNVCGAFYPPFNYSTSTTHTLCDEACSSLFIAPSGAAASPSTQQAACQKRCTVGGGAKSSYLCFQYCQAFPNDPVCKNTGAKQQIAKILSRPKCSLPRDFSNSVALCDGTFCAPFLWKDKLLDPSTPGLQTCRQVCSALFLGTSTTNVTPHLVSVREQCRAQCHQRNSYVCQVHTYMRLGQGVHFWVAW